MPRVKAEKLGSILGKTLALGFIILFIYGIYRDLFGSKKAYLSEKEKVVIDMNSANVSLPDDDFFALLEKAIRQVYVENTCNVSKRADGKYIIDISGDITSYWRDDFDSMNLGEIAYQHSTDQLFRVIQMSWKRLKQVDQIRIKYHSQDSTGQVADYNVEITPRSMVTSNSVEEWNVSDEKTKTFLRDFVLNNMRITVDTATGKRWRVVKK